MSFRTGFHKGKLGIGLATSMGMDDGTGNPRYPLDINGDIRLTGAIVDASGNVYGYQVSSNIVFRYYTYSRTIHFLKDFNRKIFNILCSQLINSR